MGIFEAAATAAALALFILLIKQVRGDINSADSRRKVLLLVLLVALANGLNPRSAHRVLKSRLPAEGPNRLCRSDGPVEAAYTLALAED